GPGVRVRRLTSGLRGAVGQVPARVAEDHFRALPREVERLGRRLRGIQHRVRAEVTHTLVDVELPVRPDDEESVPAAGAAVIRAQRETDAPDLRSIPLAAPLRPLRPVEEV